MTQDQDTRTVFECIFISIQV